MLFTSDCFLSSAPDEADSLPRLSSMTSEKVSELYSGIDTLSNLCTGLCVHIVNKDRPLPYKGSFVCLS